MPSSALLLVAGLSTAHAFAPNPPSCAANVASAFDDFVGIAAGIIGAIEKCIPDTINGRDQTACAASILGLFSNTAHAGDKISAATFNCGNVDSSCAQTILGAIDDFSAFGEQVCAAVLDCPSPGAGKDAGSGIYCAQAIIAMINNLSLSAKDIDSAVGQCTVERNVITTTPPNTTAAPDVDPAEALPPDAVAVLPERRLMLQRLDAKAQEVIARVQATYGRSPLVV